MGPAWRSWARRQLRRGKLALRPKRATGDEPQPWTGGQVSDSVFCVVAPNPSPMTLDGTNTWIVNAPGSDEAIVIDPGPDDRRHLDDVLAAVRAREAEVVATLLTHRHPDHAEGAKAFSLLAGCPVRAVDPTYRLGVEGLADDTLISVDGIDLRVLMTPGHTADSVSFLLAEERTLFAGDTVLGRGTTFVAHPDGALAAYLASLRRIQALARHGRIQRLLPGHGPVIEDAEGVLEYYLRHRQDRLDQVVEAVQAGASNAREVVERVYAEVDRALWPAAEASVRAQLDYLQDQGTVRLPDRTDRKRGAGAGAGSGLLPGSVAGSVLSSASAEEEAEVGSDEDDDDRPRPGTVSGPDV